MPDFTRFDRANPTRRVALSMMGVAFGGSVAGCLGDSDTPNDPTDDMDVTDDTEDEQSDAERAAVHLDEARAFIQAAFDELAKRDDDEFEFERFQSHLEDARIELIEVESLADNDQAQEVGSLRAIIEYLIQVGTAENAIDLGFAELGKGIDAYWMGREYYEPGIDQVPAGFKDAVENFTRSGETFEEAHEQFVSAALGFEAATERLEAIDSSNINAFDTSSHEQQLDEHEVAQYFSANMNFFARGLSEASWGWQQTSYGLVYALNDEWDEAMAHLEEARELFGEFEGDHIFVDFEFLYEFFPDLQERFEVQICENEQGTKMIDSFSAAVEHTRGGEQETPTERYQEGFSVTDSCHES